MKFEEPAAPDLPQNKSYEDLMVKFKDHYSQRNHRSEQNDFTSIIEHNSESVADYLTELQWLSFHHGFGDYLYT